MGTKQQALPEDELGLGLMCTVSVVSATVPCAPVGEAARTGEGECGAEAAGGPAW